MLLGQEAAPGHITGVQRSPETTLAQHGQAKGQTLLLQPWPLPLATFVTPTPAGTRQRCVQPSLQSK